MRNKRLITRYPFLIPRNCWTGKIPSDYDYSYTEYDCLDRGWQIEFGKYLLEDLREACIKNNFLNELQIIQWKEKYGSMRLYINGAPQDVHDVINKYEFISEYICIQCGSPYACVVNNYGWYLPLCEECWNKNNRLREKRGFKTKSWEEVAKGNVGGLPDSYSYRTFSKDDDVTTTVDISETASKIRRKYEKRVQKNGD